MLRALALVLTVLAGCGGLRADPRRPSAEDPAVELAERLPGGFGRCVASRVERVPHARRAAVRAISQAWGVAFTPGAPVVAYALASDRFGPGGPFVALVRTSASATEVRRFFESRAQETLSFDDRILCEDGICRPVTIELVEPTLVRISQGSLAEGRAGSSAPRCAALLRANPSAIEVAVAVADAGAHGASALEAESMLYAENDGLRISRTERYADAHAAAAAARRQAVLPPEPGWIDAAEPLERAAVGSELRFAADVTFHDLALRAQDAARLRRAMASEMAFAWRIVPIEAIDARRFDVVDRQVYVRHQRLKEARGDDVRALARELASLLDRAIAVHPEQERLAEVRFEVLLESLGDARAAAESAELALAAHPTDRAGWLVRRREALLRFDLDRAAVALEEASVADEGRGRDAAVALRALLDGAGEAEEFGAVPVSYAQAEAALAAVERLDGRSPEPRLPEPVVVPFQSLAETALALFELRGLAAPSDRLLTVVSGSLSPGAEPPAPFVALTPRDGADRRMAITSIDARGALRAFGRALERAVGEGPNVIVFTLVSGARERRRGDVAIVLSGRASPQGFRLEAARGGTSEWPLAARLLAEPLSRMHPFHDPAPAFSVELAGEGERRAVRERVEDLEGLECAPSEGARLACRSTLVGSALRRAWVRAIGPLLPQ